ncbi:hypothetical protein JOF33_001937 [Corynebacterium freneyi]|uniref:Uncharacterized protein n=1 Tax=Corynebacterium freneyi TaxID=134034 RepID=A0ABS4U9M3_9CORY|nr:hypothetical protein [Corynebacterium freneyi]
MQPVSVRAATPKAATTARIRRPRISSAPIFLNRSTHSLMSSAAFAARLLYDAPAESVPARERMRNTYPVNLVC